MNGLASYELLVQRLKQPNSLLLRDQIDRGDHDQ